MNLAAVTGTLVVRYSSGSMLLTGAMPIEVRDRHHALVRVVTGPETRLALSPGLYSVTAILENGERDTRVVDVQSGRAESIEFAVSAGEVYLERAIARGAPLRRLVDAAAASRGSATATAPGSAFEIGAGAAAGTSTATASGVALLPPGQRDAYAIDATTWLAASSPGLELTREGDGVVEIAHHAEADEVAWIEVLRGGELIWLALPLSRHSDEARRCTLRFGAGGAPRIELPAARRVTRALHGMIESGKLGPAIELADHSAALLASKYQDPIGAAYGGLMLQRFGALDRHADWVENLARDFAWLPDGQILLAAVLARRDPARGLAALLDATRTPCTVFSDAFSLALSLLRRWPGDDGRCEARLAELAPATARYDFSSPYATLRGAPGGR